ncbi:MAG TPA: agmatine deiminase family protein [Kiritimatiellia bacterium]|nr:agmatine deiminase family protein [Kiritimatiellia bacterium]
MPSSKNYLMPPEWAPHHATWIGWPHNTSDWPGKFAPIPWVFAEMVRHISPGETVRILVNDAAHEAKARNILTRSGIDLANLSFHRWPTDRGWTRDFGPITVLDPKRRPHILDARFNAWAKYPDHKKDQRIAARAAKALSRPLLSLEHQGRPVTLEGGALDVNGHGVVITTEECLLHPEIQIRNPGFNANDYQAVFARALGCSTTWWLGSGIAGDDTHGHVDDLCRFVNPTTAVLCHESNPSDPNYRPLAENWERVPGFRLPDGSRPTFIKLPMPAPVHFRRQRLPASYANFYIANAAVLVPTFNDPNDRIALGILGELITDRPIIGIHARDLVWGLGAIHCLTQQDPRGA